MRPIIATCLIAIACAFIGCGDKGTESPEPDFSLSLRPQNTTIALGSNETFTLDITSVEDMFLMTMDLAYDTTIVRLDSISIPEGSVLADGAISFYDRVAGGVSLGIGNIQTSGDDDVSGSGTLLDIDFTGLGIGSTEISIDNVMILDESGEVNPDLSNLIAIGANVTVE